MEIICGVNAVREALKAGRRKILSLYVAEGKKETSISDVIVAAEKKGIKIKPISRQKLFGLTGVETNQGVAAEIESFRYVSIEELVILAGKTPFWVILDQIHDPHNFGAIIRTAHLLGVNGIIIPKDNSVDVGPTVAKAASGAIEYLPIAKVTNLSNAINYLKDNNIWVVGAEGGAQKSVYQYDFTGAVAVVLGGEGKGIRRLVKEHCDELLTIPMMGKIGSFNVSVAGAIFMSEAMRQRLSKKCAEIP